MDDEVTRVEAVRYLEGVSGHGVLSTLFLVVAGLFAALGRGGAGTLAVIVAYGVALNGVSIYVWNRLRDHFTSTRDGAAAEPGRPLSPDVSQATKAQLLAGFCMLVGLVAVLLAVIGVVRLVGVAYAVPVLAGGLGAGNVGALGWAYYATARG